MSLSKTPRFSRKSGRRRFPKAYFVAARLLPLRPAADHPAPDALVSPSLSAAPRVSRLPQIEGDKEPRKKFKAYPIASSTSTSPKCKPRKALSLRRHHRTSKFARSTHPQSQYADRARLLRALVAAVPYKSRSCSPTIEFNSPTCQRTDQIQPPSSAPSFRPRLSRTRDRTSALPGLYRRPRLACNGCAIAAAWRTSFG